MSNYFMHVYYKKLHFMLDEAIDEYQELHGKSVDLKEFSNWVESQCKFYEVKPLEYWKERELLMADGYPTDDFLISLSESSWDDSFTYEDFIKLIDKAWNKFGMDNFCKIEDGKCYLNTGGWSGNESIIHAIKQNLNIWVHVKIAQGELYSAEYILEKRVLK